MNRPASSSPSSPQHPSGPAMAPGPDTVARSGSVSPLGSSAAGSTQDPDEIERSAAAEPGSDFDEATAVAVADLYHRLLTGTILALVVEQGEERAAEVLFALFRRQHLEKFLPGLEKLGLVDEPDAVACAKYHYLSNHVGGVGVAFIPESDRKAWVRYLPPRWIFDGTALAAIPTRVARSMLWAWHGHNGVSLDNPRLGFVCTGQTMDGRPGLEGYYIEEDVELALEDRVRFRFGERCPPIDPAALPSLDADTWPAERLAKASRNYSMDYVRNLIVVLHELLGPLDAAGLLYRTGRRMGMQYAAAATAHLHGLAPVEVLARLFAAQGDDVSVDPATNTIEIGSWRLLRGLEAEHVPEWFDGWIGLWEGVLAVVDPDVHLLVTSRLDLGDATTGLVLRPRATPSRF